jgi:tripartite-type tricarboxylate transporter receptor subunit TctC
LELKGKSMKKQLPIFILALVASSAQAWAQTPFYQGKTITVVAAASAGSAYDLYARLMAQFMGKHIPGNPSLIVQNMTGAGSIIGTNYIYNVSKPDGLTIGAIQPSIYFNQLMKQKEVRYDWAKLGWIGSSDKSDYLLYMRADLPYKTLADVRKAKEPPKCGSTGAGTSGSYMPKLLEEILGTKFTIVAGYQGGGEIDLAVERGELHCRAFTIQAYHSREPYHTWRKKGFVRNIIQTGKKRDSKLPDTETIWELMDRYKTPEASRRLATVMLASGALGRPMLATPGVPADRVKILRDAFKRTMEDKEFLAELDKRKFDLDPVPGEELEKIVKDVMSQPPEIIERMKKLLGQ